MGFIVEVDLSLIFLRGVKPAIGFRPMASCLRMIRWQKLKRQPFTGVQKFRPNDPPIVNKTDSDSAPFKTVIVAAAHALPIPEADDFFCNASSQPFRILAKTSSSSKSNYVSRELLGI